MLPKRNSGSETREAKLGIGETVNLLKKTKNIKKSLKNDF
jgi:hypothetical protein